MNRNRAGLAFGLASAFLVGCEKPVPRKGFQSQEEGKATETAGFEKPAVDSKGGKEILEDPSADPFMSTSLPETDSPETVVSSERRRLLKIRRRLTGHTFVNLHVGDHFMPDATIRWIDDSGVQIEFRTGIATFAWAELPESYRRDWGYDPDREIEVVRDTEGIGDFFGDSEAIEDE